MPTLRCAVVGCATVAPVHEALTSDATVRDLQRALATSGSCDHTRGDAEDAHAAANERKKTTMMTPLLPPSPRLFLATTTRCERECALLEDARWLQTSDSVLEALLAPAHDSSSSSSSSSRWPVDGAVVAVRREYLAPERELLPHTKLLEVFQGVREDDNDSAASAASSVHVLAVFPEEAAAATGAGDAPTDPNSDSGGPSCDDGMDAGSFDSDSDNDNSDDAMDDDADDDAVYAMPPTHNPYLLHLLRPQYEATPRERFELRPAPVGDKAVAALLGRLVRAEAEYGAVLSRVGRRARCLKLLFAAVCALFPRGSDSREPQSQLRERVKIPGHDLRVLATFDYTLRRGGTHVGVVVAKPRATHRRCAHYWCQHRRKRQLRQPHAQQSQLQQQPQQQLCDADSDDDSDSGDERLSQQDRLDRRARARAAMERALQRSWLGAEVLADTAHAKPPRVVFGVVTSYRDWVFLRYDGVRVQAHEATLQLARGGVVPLRASLAEIVGLVAQMLR